jgi:hypothetical protein
VLRAACKSGDGAQVLARSQPRRRVPVHSPVNQAAGPTPAQNTITITGSTWEQTTGRATGFHAGADATYFFSPNVGVGGGIRISRGTVELDREPMSEVRQDITVGGTEVFVGLRFRFNK